MTQLRKRGHSERNCEPFCSGTMSRRRITAQLVLTLTSPSRPSCKQTRVTPKAGMANRPLLSLHDWMPAPTICLPYVAKHGVHLKGSAAQILSGLVDRSWIELVSLPSQEGSDVCFPSIELGPPWVSDIVFCSEGPSCSKLT